jgi:hypothetical protein
MNAVPQYIFVCFGAGSPKYIVPPPPPKYPMPKRSPAERRWEERRAEERRRETRRLIEKDRRTIEAMCRVARMMLRVP